ncbi:MAG: hypothetical protein ACJ75J_04455 [Cytophagaceae bacterium]
MHSSISVKKYTFNSDYIIYFIVGIKVVLMLLFSSDYEEKLFIPFISHFLSDLNDPWAYFYAHPEGVEFPYHPLMLYIISLFYSPVHFIFGENILIQNFFYKIPILISDILIFNFLKRSFPSYSKEILLFYFTSPIIIYASYIHSQLDLIPTCILFLSIFYLTRGRILKAAIFFGLALSIKLHVLGALPLLIIFLLRKDAYKEIVILLGVSSLIYLLFLFPFLSSEGFINMVLRNPKQQLVFDSVLTLSNMKIVLPLLAAVLIYARFLLYKKVNNDLLYTFLAILFSLFVILIPPSPAWYLWIFPFLSIFFIKNFQQNTKIVYLYVMLNFFYIAFFVFFYIPDHHDINFLGAYLDIKNTNPVLNNFFFTTLAGILTACVYSFYNFGVRSNSIYQKTNSILIGIGGDSGSGKSTLLEDLRLILGAKMTDLEGDGDHKWERNDENWKQITHLNPKGNFLHKQAEDLMRLKYGKSIQRSDYDHKTGSFMSSRIVNSNEYVSICGLHPFYLPVMRKIIDLKIFVDTEENLRQHWKVIRDIKKRGYTKEQILNQIRQREIDSLKYISPQKNFADLVINYFSEDNFEIGNETEKPKIKLKIILNADVHIEPLIQKFLENGIELGWDYSEDLNTQYLIFDKDVSALLIGEIGKAIIVNIEDLTSPELFWKDSYRGYVQLIILYVLSERLRVFDSETPKQLNERR